MKGFKRFQAEGYAASLLGLVLSREMVPVLAGLMVAGRVGSSMAAEIGTMKVTDQVAALQTMATDPVQYLVVPRVIATTLMLPLLVAFGNIVGLFGGYYLIHYVMGDPTPGFFDRVFEFMDGFDFWSGLIKAAVFGAV